jgi:secondary thiamine-phosphate synthase enzyme
MRGTPATFAERRLDPPRAGCQAVERAEPVRVGGGHLIYARIRATLRTMAPIAASRGGGGVYQREIELETRGRGTYEITERVAEAVRASRVAAGLCHVFTTHTSASLLICENADPDVRRDLEMFMADLVPDGDPRFVHTAEGADDMPAHLRSILTQTDLTIPVRDGRLALGTWQGVYLYEHRLRPHHRRVLVTVQG